ncbi:sialate O-acetylesterase [Spirosomataceae bacterium TFI 002]|nr:sialate O-acetylesterase [Spirosomataceae bacterium TFI 002]
MKYFFKTLLCVLIFSQVSAQLKLANVFGDHMVLQRNNTIKIWGTSQPNESIKLTLGQKNIVTKANNNGKWIATSDGMLAGGPYKMVVKGETETILVDDILIGDVWLCSGQSNMEWTLKDTDSAEEEIAKANFPQIRHLKVKRELAFEPQSDIAATEWETASPSTVPNFTAVGYYFAKKLQAEIGVPIGLINSSWGGSHVETWISQEAMANSGVLGYYAKKMPKSLDASAQKIEQGILKTLYDNPKTDLSQIDESAYLVSNYDYSKWLKIGTGQWDWQGFAGYRGEAFLHKEVVLDQSFVDQNTQVKFGSNTGQFILYINGELIAKGVYPDGIELSIPKNTWVAGANQIVIITSQNENDGPMGIYGSKSNFYVSNGTQKVYLANEKWDMIPRWNDKRHYANWMNNEGTLCYNAMIAPIINFPISGAIWYQGESNAGRAYQYRESFPLLIESWRKDWGLDFPFFFVQLSSYGGFQSSNEGSDWAELREAQTMTLKLPKTGMAVTTDIGNPGNIHPTNKLDVGERLAKSALKVAYGKNIVGNGPMYQSMVVKKEKAILSFTDIGSGLKVKDKYGYLQGFEIAGADQKFYYAQAKVVGNQIEVSHPSVPSPKAVRYGWTNSPIDANLFNKDGFPASPFRTDSWKGVTEGVKFE